MTMDANVSARIDLLCRVPICGMTPVQISQLPDPICVGSNGIARNAFSGIRTLPVESRG